MRYWRPFAVSPPGTTTITIILTNRVGARVLLAPIAIVDDDDQRRRPISLTAATATPPPRRVTFAGAHQIDLH